MDGVKVNKVSPTNALEFEKPKNLQNRSSFCNGYWLIPYFVLPILCIDINDDTVCNT